MITYNICINIHCVPSHCHGSRLFSSRSECASCFLVIIIIITHPPPPHNLPPNGARWLKLTIPLESPSQLGFHSTTQTQRQPHILKAHGFLCVRECTGGIYKSVYNKYIHVSIIHIRGIVKNKYNLHSFCYTYIISYSFIWALILIWIPCSSLHALLLLPLPRSPDGLAVIASSSLLNEICVSNLIFFFIFFNSLLSFAWLCLARLLYRHLQFLVSGFGDLIITKSLKIFNMIMLSSCRLFEYIRFEAMLLQNFGSKWKYADRWIESYI